MFRMTLILGIVLPVILTLNGNHTETLVDLYNRITTHGSLLKATSFDARTQSKLKDINTVRMVTYRVPNHRTSIGIRLKKNANEQIMLIELQCSISSIHVRLGRYGRRRKFRLSKISHSLSATSSYDLTHFLNRYRQRTIHLILERPIRDQNLSIFYYSKSTKNLFSFSSTKSLKRRFRRTILPTSPSSTCAKHEYEIDFSQFSFGQWILQPKRFNAYTCSGSCPNPLSPQYYPSNHAILLSLMRSQREHGQQALCVPVQLKPLCLLYYDRDELVIKYHRDMIVQECGCR